TDANSGEPMSGVSVSQKGTTNGTTTNDAGLFVLDNVPEGALVFISFVGYDPAERPASTDPLTVQLNPSVNMLEDVVVIGYGSVKRKDVTTAISSVSMDDLDE